MLSDKRWSACVPALDSSLCRPQNEGGWVAFAGHREPWGHWGPRSPPEQSAGSPRTGVQAALSPQLDQALILFAS